jgi:CRISPR-associated protein Cmr5
MNIPTLDQKRAQNAWETVKDKKGDNAKNFGDVCKQTSTRIQNSGLCPALAYLDSKKEKDLSNELGSYLLSLGFIRGNQNDKVLQRLIQSDTYILRRATDEALAYLAWLARFADAGALDKKGKGE